MAVIKAADIVDFVIKAKNAGWGYVFGGQGQVYTRELAEKWAAQKKSGRGYDYYIVKCAKWFGKIVVDCSGLVIEAYRSKIPGYGDKTANTIYSKSVQKGKISTIPEIPGLCIWRSGHIGIYIGNGKVIESGGTSVGVVLSKLTAPATGKKWTNWGRMADVDYTNTTIPKQPDPSSCWVGRYLKIKAPYMRGGDVEQVQTALKNSGFDPGPIDGIYGPYTERAVKEFQKKKGLKVDGIVGPETAKALLGCWVDGGEPTMDPPLDSFELGRLLKVTSPYMRGEDVTDVQYALAYHNFSPGTIDGIYGPKTESAVKGFQRKKKLKVDGIVGPETTNALGGTWTGE